MWLFVFLVFFRRSLKSINLDNLLNRYHNRSTIRINKKINLREKYSRKYLLKKSNTEGIVLSKILIEKSDKSEICPPLLLVPCTNHISDLGLCNQGPAYGLRPSPTAAVSAPTQPSISFLVLLGYFGAATTAGG